MIKDLHPDQIIKVSSADMTAEQQPVTGGVDISNLFAAGVSGAIGGGSVGAGLGTLAGAGVMRVPAAAVLGLTGASMGFIDKFARKSSVQSEAMSLGSSL